MSETEAIARSEQPTTKLGKVEAPEIPVPEEPDSLEESTVPETDEELLLNKVCRSAIETTLRHFFLEQSQDFLSRGFPALDHVFYDYEHDCPHVVLELRIPFRDPSEATLKGVREELTALGSKLADLFDSTYIAVSARLN